MSDMKTVIDFGADPTGRNDSSAAFSTMAEATGYAEVLVPAGDFVIAQTVDLKGRSLRGAGRAREGKDSRTRIRCAGNLDGPMFKNQGATVSDLYLYGGGEKAGKTAFEAIGYNSVFRNIHFTGWGAGIDIREITVNFNLIACVFIMVGTGLRVRDVNNNQSTTSRFTANEFNNCGNAIVYDRMLVGASFRDNIFEFLSGDAVIASHIYNSSFIGNWWEKRRPDGTLSPFGNAKASEGGYPPVRTREHQQIMRSFAACNSTSWGWRDDFGTETHDNRVGGVSLNGGEIVVRESTGRGLRITDSSIARESAEWAGLEPFMIDAGHNLRARPGMVLRTGGGPLRFEDGEDLGFGGTLTFAKGGGREERLALNRNLRGVPTAGMVGVSEVDVGGETRKALTGIPQFFLWRQDKLARGLDALKLCEVVKTGTVRFVFPYVIDNPIPTVSVLDSGIQFDGMSYVDSYVNGSRSRVQCTGLDLRFTDRQGNPVTPEAFTMQLLTVAPGVM